MSEPIEQIKESQLYATAAVLMDADTGRVLYGKNADAPMAMASTTKIMTCITVLEHGNLEDVMTVSSYAAGMPKVKLSVKKGEQYQVKDLLHSLMLESHNDSAVVLAEYIGKNYLSEELKNKDTAEFTKEESKLAVAAFAKLMNEKAKELGCEDTWFVTPNGLDASQSFTLESGEEIEVDHHTTATELSKMMAYCIKESPQKEKFLEITRRGAYSFSANGRNFSCTNHNAFLSMMEGALSGKTGFTNKAGYCYVGALERDGRTFVVALLACGWPNNKSYKWSDTKKLMQYGVDNYFYRSFLEEGTAFDEKHLKPIRVLGGRTATLGDVAYTQVVMEKEPEKNAGLSMQEDRERGEQKETNDNINGVAGKDYEGILLRKDEEIKVSYNQEEVLPAPVEKGMVVGEVNYTVNDVIYRTEKLVISESIDKIDWDWCLEQVWGRYLLW
ncbi:MAG: D-alanyl-D-alanine carboxypeptidase [Lachnospiraceae bacterium]|nr:D-alanyl-D-alanine carboxypeptidase [Lachnospiraceae bacterium]